jgi:hypothetical protein
VQISDVLFVPPALQLPACVKLNDPPIAADAVNVTTPLGALSPLIPVPANVATTLTAAVDPYVSATVTGVTVTVGVAVPLTVRLSVATPLAP